MSNTVLILDYGSQYTQLIARRVRELNVYCEIVPFDEPTDSIVGRRPLRLFSVADRPVSHQKMRRRSIGDCLP